MTEAVVAIHGRRLDARYTLIEKLGAGGQGEVWRAHDDTRGVDIALKVLNPALARSEAAWAALEHEYTIASRLDHASVLKVFPPERSGDVVVLPMELAAGGDLRRLRGAGYLEIIPVLIEVAQALEHAHDRGVVHRDLKPGNVLFDARGRVRLADFGVAGTQADPLNRGLSPFTASPEQLRGEPPAPADDTYGLGALAYELLSGYPPYYPHFDQKRAEEEPVPALVPTRQIPPLLSALVMRMLEKDPQERPRSMREVIDDLDAALNDTLTFDFEAAQAAGLVPHTPAAANPTRPSAATPASTPTRGFPAAAPQAGANAITDGPFATQAGAEASHPGAPPAGHSPQPRAPNAGHAAAGHATAATGTVGIHADRPPWDDLKLEAVPRVARLEPIRKRRRWPYVMLVLLIGAAVAVFYWLPSFTPQPLPDILTNVGKAPGAGAEGTKPGEPTSAEDSGAAGSEPSAADKQAAEAAAAQAAEDKLQQVRADFDRRLAALDERGAGVWGGVDFATAKTRAAESVGAHDAGNTKIAQERLDDASRLLTAVEKRAAQALTAQIEAGEKALAAGQEELAAQAFELGKRIDPNDKRVADGERRVHRLGGVLPLLADAQNAEAAHNYSRASQDYRQALALDPANAKARSGLPRADAAFGDDSYAKAVGSGFAALGAGRLDDARDAFERARKVRPNGSEAAEGLRRVEAALASRNFASIRQRAAGLEAQERWEEAAQAYDSALQTDPSLVFAQQGKSRAAARAELSKSLQSLIDRPERLASVSVRDEARSLLETARGQSPSGPVLRSQIARVELMLPEFDRPVRLSLVSDNATQVAIPSIGSFGTFAKREIELKPGKYTVIGTRNGYRDVRRDITVVPGQENQTVSVSCLDPI